MVMAQTNKQGCYPPWNFSWVVQNKLAAMGWPQSVDNLHYVVSQGVNYLVTLSPEKRPPVACFADLNWTLIGIEEFETPSIRQIEQFISICQCANLNGGVVGIHCRKGRGRTGVMAACYLVYFHDQTPGRAISNVRLLRPGSIETYEQERIVATYHDTLRSGKQ